jgi:ferredoxin
MRKGGKMVSVNKEKCIGCGACESICSAVFEVKDGKSQVKKGQEKSKAPCVKEAAESCPVGAIKN